MADDLRPSPVPPGPDLPPRERLLSVDEFMRMGELGLLEEPGKHELWDGRLVMTPPPGSPHMDRESRIVQTLILALHGVGMLHRFRVQTGGGLKIGELNFRAPDVMIVRLPFDVDNLLTGEGVALVIEVANSSLSFDLGEKRGKYAAAGIEEYWVVDVAQGRLHPFRRPKAGDYPPCTPLAAGAVIAPLFAPDLRLKVEDLV